jgi:hypothetical protein
VLHGKQDLTLLLRQHFRPSGNFLQRTKTANAKPGPDTHLANADAGGLHNHYIISGCSRDGDEPSGLSSQASGQPAVALLVLLA